MRDDQPTAKHSRMQAYTTSPSSIWRNKASFEQAGAGIIARPRLALPRGGTQCSHVWPCRSLGLDKWRSDPYPNHWKYDHQSAFDHQSPHQIATHLIVFDHAFRSLTCITKRGLCRCYTILSANSEQDRTANLLCSSSRVVEKNLQCKASRDLIAECTSLICRNQRQIAIHCVVGVHESRLTWSSSKGYRDHVLTPPKKEVRHALEHCLGNRQGRQL